MRKTNTKLTIFGAAVTLLFSLAASKRNGARSSMLKCGTNCSTYQRTDSLPEHPPQGMTRLAIGGDSRDDSALVVPWAFKEAQTRGANAFFFLGDLELTPAEDDLFLKKIPILGEVPFYPLMGNHEVETLGFVRMPRKVSRQRVKEFKEKFLQAHPVNFADVDDATAFSVELPGGVHFIALDNVSRKGEGFGANQLAWLKHDLQTASTAKKTILVGMHKGLANNPVTTHAMDEDGKSAIKDSNGALALFQQYKVALLVVSHSHMYAAYSQGGIEVRLTGGMGAPLVKGLTPAEGAFHHFLLVDVPAGENTTPLRVEVVRFPFPEKAKWSLADELKEKE